MRNYDARRMNNKNAKITLLDITESVDKPDDPLDAAFILFGVDAVASDDAVSFRLRPSEYWLEGLKPEFTWRETILAAALMAFASPS